MSLQNPKFAPAAAPGSIGAGRDGVQGVKKRHEAARGLLKAPFPAFGGKSQVVDLVWARLGDPRNYAEPFAFSSVMLLRRPSVGAIETINDLNAFVCLAPETRVLGTDLRYRRIDTVNPGDKLLAFDEHNGPAREGFRAPTRYRRWKVATVLAVRRVMKPCYRVRFEDGTEIVASEDHQWLVGSHPPGDGKKGGRGWRWGATKSLVGNRQTQKSWVLRLAPRQEREETYEAGWLGGAFDGEGSVAGAGGGQLNFTQNGGPVLERVKALLAARGFSCAASKHGTRCNTLRVNGGQLDTLRFLMLARPGRLIADFLKLLENRSIYGRQHNAVGVAEKEFVGMREVIAIETDTHTFIAEGLASHNCNFWRAIQRDPDEVAAHADWPVNECVPAGTMIAIPGGQIPVEQVRDGMTVLGFEDGEIVETCVTATKSSVTSEVLCGVGPLRLTGNHPVYTHEYGYIEACRLKPGMTSIILGGEHDAPTLDYLLLIRSSQQRDSLRGDDFSQMPVQRTFVSGEEGRPDTPGSLGAVAPNIELATDVCGVGAGNWRGLASRRGAVDCAPRSGWASYKSDEGRRGNARVCADARTAREVVEDTAREEIRAWSQVGNARKAAWSRSTSEDFCGGASSAHIGGESQNIQISQGAGYGKGCSSLNSCEGWPPFEDGASSENSGGNHQPPNSILRRDGRTLLLCNRGEPGFGGERGICQSGTPQGLPVQGSIAPLRVYNFQTDAANYFANGVLVHNCDLHARHRWLVQSHESQNRLQKVRDDPEYFDAKIAGWWCWGACCWIGSGWCEEQQLPHLNHSQGVNGLTQKLPHLVARGAAGGDSNHQKRPVISADGSEFGRGIHGGGCRLSSPQLADAFSRGRGVNGHDQAGTCEQRRRWITNWFMRLADRLRPVRVCCGHWSRICDSDSTLTRLGTTGVFLDPPYRHSIDGIEGENRSKHLYANDRTQDVNALCDEVQAWCIKWGQDKEIRIALCGLEGEYPMLTPELGWECVPWASRGGYGNRTEKGKLNAKRERIWFNKSCLPADPVADLFSEIV